MGWISVDDELPQTGKFVIGATPIDDETWCIQIGRFRLSEDPGGVAVIKVGDGWSWISHWMPLPVPPAGITRG